MSWRLTSKRQASNDDSSVEDMIGKCSVSEGGWVGATLALAKRVCKRLRVSNGQIE